MFPPIRWSVLALSLLLVACPKQAPSPEVGDASSTASSPAATSMPEAQSEPTPPSHLQAKRPAGEENTPIQAWRGFGTEPFWEARVEGDTLVFSTPDNNDGVSMKGRRVPSLVGYVFVGKDGDKDFHLGLTPGECTDGMSDNRYTFTATFIHGATTYHGCGEVAK